MDFVVVRIRSMAQNDEAGGSKWMALCAQHGLHETDADDEMEMDQDQDHRQSAPADGEGNETTTSGGEGNETNTSGAEGNESTAPSGGEGSESTTAPSGGEGGSEAKRQRKARRANVLSTKRETFEMIDPKCRGVTTANPMLEQLGFSE